MYILGAKVDSITSDEAIRRIASFLNEAKRHFVATPNPEIILYAHKHAGYRAILNKADLALPDGAGLLWAARYQGEPLKERVSGTDLAPEICRLAAERSLKIALVGGLDQRAIEKAAAVMRKWGNEVVYANYGVSKEHWNDPSFHEKMIHELRATSPALIFVAFGHPKQEQWIDTHRNDLPSVRLFMGCGGALDFIAGAAHRAPVWMRRAGLEWLWRLVREPKRLKRIFNAVIVFPLIVIYARFRKK